MKRYEHGSALVKFGDVDFFADSAKLGFEDEQIGQMLCGFAFDAGAEIAFLEHDAWCGCPSLRDCVGFGR